MTALHGRDMGAHQQVTCRGQGVGVERSLPISLYFSSLVAVLKATFFMWFHLVSRDESAPLTLVFRFSIRPSDDCPCKLGPNGPAHSVSITAEQNQTGLQAACAPRPLSQQALRGYPKLPLFFISVSLRAGDDHACRRRKSKPMQVPILRISSRPRKGSSGR